MKKAECKSMSAAECNGFSMATALKALKKSDPELIPLLDAFNIQDLEVKTNYFQALVRSIIYQQLSGKAAQTIAQRFKALFDGTDLPGPHDVVIKDHQTLRSAGLSNSKASYIHNIAHAFLNGTIDHKNLGSMSNSEIVDQLPSVKGVGPWTAQMFLMFTLNRPDIFPTTDLGIQKGYQKFYKLSDLPKSIDMEVRSQPWKPYRTAVSLYFWRLVEGPFIW